MADLSSAEENVAVWTPQSAALLGSLSRFSRQTVAAPVPSPPPKLYSTFPLPATSFSFSSCPLLLPCNLSSARGLGYPLSIPKITIASPIPTATVLALSTRLSQPIFPAEPTTVGLSCLVSSTKAALAPQPDRSVSQIESPTTLPSPPPSLLHQVPSLIRFFPMYNTHRGMVPAPNSRLTELLDQLRQEFESQSRSTGEYEHQLTGQLQEMEMIRQKVYQLEQTQIKMKADYEAEIRMLRHELEQRGVQPVASHIAASQHSGPQAQPPSLGHGPSNLFGGIMTNPAGSGPGLAPPPSQEQQPPQHTLQQPASATQPGYGPPPPPTASPGPGKGRRTVPGPATPQQTQIAYPDPRASPQIPRPTPPTQNLVRADRPGNMLANWDPADLPASQKREGSDWYAVFNPEVQRVLDVELVHHLNHDSVVCCVRFSRDGKYLATGCNRSAQIFDVTTGQNVATLQDENVDKDGDLYIRSVCFSPDGKYLATGAEDKQIRVWDIAARTIKHIFSGHEQDIYSLDFAGNGRYIASGSGDKTVRLWDILDGKLVYTLSIEDGVTTVAMSPDGHYVAAGSLDKSVRVWDTTTGYLVERLENPDGHKDSVYSVAFAPNGRDLVSGSLDKTIKLWELTVPRGMHPHNGNKGGKCIRTFEGHKDFVLSVCLTPDGQWVMSGSKDRGVQFWDPVTGNAQMMLQGHKNSVISVAPAPTGNLFATGSGDMRARIWSLGRREHVLGTRS
ncbi:Transcriptional repressor rco-1 [Penicillium oxalicum]|uniref:Transcriptional repressor rco-1 n=1 Tax=Penicillium oxalicum TaxID=69781 RepID=UPI0020B6451F|nr:Transcriptional repressor rco-1 [Penicillium oxalicum]KAI2791603.1 Transcriptional repressor rco-1 [Penicillium oxalicum]